MAKIVLTITILFSLLISSCKETYSKNIDLQHSFGNELTENGEILVMRVKLLTDLDKIELPPYCGTVIFNMSFEYEVIEVIEGIYTAKTIWINETCPRETVENKFIETGKTYKHRLKKWFHSQQYKGIRDSESNYQEYEVVL
ncbi:MAG: hypothetical protein ACO1N0_11515 [Fluviicola sp.]